MYFADSNSQPRITLSFTHASNEYCKDEPCIGNLETLSVLLNKCLTVSLSVSPFEREREGDSGGTIHSSHERDTFSEKNHYPFIFSNVLNGLKINIQSFSLPLRPTLMCLPNF